MIVDFDRTLPHDFCGTTTMGKREGGCGEPVFYQRPWIDEQHIAIRCADCLTVYCPLCARKHFADSKQNYIELATRHERLKLATRRLVRVSKDWSCDDLRDAIEKADAEVSDGTPQGG